MMEEMIRDEQYAKQDAIRGCLIGGAAGDALGYPVEFMDEDDILARYGEQGIQSYTLDRQSGKAVISDDTQMSLFTANAILFGQTRGCLRGIGGMPSMYAHQAYGEWYATQTSSFERYQTKKHRKDAHPTCWLTDVPELFVRRAPGNACMNMLFRITAGEEPENNSKGCGGVMRVAPLGTVYGHWNPAVVANEGAEMTKVTHQHPLGYMTSAMLVYIIHTAIFSRGGRTLKSIVESSIDFIADAYKGQPYTDGLVDLMRETIALSENGEPDLDNIHRLGEGWVAEEALAISVYCALRHESDFSAGIIAAVNHKGDSDSTGAITGNILGAWLGFDAIDDKWKTDLELYPVLLEMADDLHHGCTLDGYKHDEDDPWLRKYVHATWKAQPKPVFFWHEYEMNGEFSNWYEAPFEIDGFIYSTVEQYMMARKAKLFHDAARYTQILRAASPEECKNLGRKVAPFDSAAWDAVSCEAVKTATRAKYIQHPELLKALLETGDSPLAEASPRDTVWGIGMTAAEAAKTLPEDWKGENRLGQILMEVREELRETLANAPRPAVILKSITELHVDAIVNAADQKLSGGGGVDEVIHEAAGPELTAECRKIGHCPTGMTRITKGYQLPCDYVLHTVGPKWIDGSESERELLASCYRTSLELALELGLRSIVFTSISTGIYHFPLQEAAGIAVREVFRFILEHPGAFDLIDWAVIDPTTRDAYDAAIGELPEA